MDIIPSNDDQGILNKEFAENLGRSDGLDVIFYLQNCFGEDFHDWFYRRVWPNFAHHSDISPQYDSTIIYSKSMTLVSLFQSARGVVAAIQSGYIPTDKEQWYTKWLLRIIIGEEEAKHASETWLPEFKKLDQERQIRAFSDMLGRCLPKIPAKNFMLYAYATTLDIRVRATTAWAFGDKSKAMDFHKEAVSLDDKLDKTIQHYQNGGGIFYVLEKEDGLVITEAQNYGLIFNLWTQEDFAKEMNEGKFGGKHRISTMNYRELEGQLQDLWSEGIRYVTVDRRMDGPVRIIPLEDIVQHVKEVILTVDTSDLGRQMRLED